VEKDTERQQEQHQMQLRDRSRLKLPDMYVAHRLLPIMWKLSH